MLQLRLMEKKHELVRQDDVNELIDQIAGITLTQLSGMAARCSRDIVRRNIDAVVMQIRREIAEACNKAADAANEPPLDEKDCRQTSFEPRTGQAVLHGRGESSGS